jgi:hypothetical protein
MLHRFHHHTATAPAPSSVVTQLNWVAKHYRRSMLIFVVSDEPEISDALSEVLTQLTARHDVLWAMVADMAAVGSVDDEDDGYDVAGGRVVLGGTALGPQVVEAYRRAELERREHLSTFMTTHGVPHARFTGSTRIRAGLTAMTGAFARVR